MCGRNRWALGKCRGNQPLIGCLIISLTHSLLLEIRAVLIIQEAKYKLVYLTQLFIAPLTLHLHSTEQCIQKHYTNYAIEKYTQCKLQTEKLHNANDMHACDHMFITNTLMVNLNMIQHFKIWARVLKRARDAILSSNIIFHSLQGLHR